MGPGSEKNKSMGETTRKEERQEDDIWVRCRGASSGRGPSRTDRSRGTELDRGRKNPGGSGTMEREL